MSKRRLNKGDEESTKKQKQVKSEWEIIYEKTISETDNVRKCAVLSVNTDKNWKSVNLRVFRKQNDEVQFTRIGLAFTIRECKLLYEKLQNHIFFTCEQNISSTCDHDENCSFSYNSSDKQIIRIAEEYAPIYVLITSEYFTIIKQVEKELNLSDSMQGVNGINITKGEYRDFMYALHKILKSERKLKQ
jgi:hypothetical protein